ncbi:MAG TPA: SCO family protein [Pyrinomonadaceae bacterium]|jgi:protein SCO1/2
MLRSLISKRSKPVFDKDTPEDTIAAFVDTVKQSRRSINLLVDLLPEQSPFYKGRGTNQIIRLRGYIMAAFGQVGLPDRALPYVLDELESGNDAYLVAASAIALRGLRQPTPDVVPYLFKAVINIRYHDDSLTFDCYKPQYPLANGTTALTEIFKTFGWLGAYAKDALSDLRNLSDSKEYSFSAPIRAEIEKAIISIGNDKRLVNTDCCSFPADFRIARRSPKARLKNNAPFEDIEFQDDDGNVFKYGDFFSRKPSVVVFFYTRCSNPNKCALTITKLAWLQKALKEQGLENDIKTAAITYDSGYDLAPRLKAYGQNRGVLFSEQNKILRTTRGFESLRDYFQLGVNFVNSIVNKHRIELYILDADGKIAFTFARFQWDVQEVINRTKQVLNGDMDKDFHRQTYNLRNRVRYFGKASYGLTVSSLIPLGIIFFPKCPLCWAAYLSFFGIAGLQSIPYSPWLLLFFVLLMMINLVSIFKRAKNIGRFGSFYLSLLGILLVLIPGTYFNFQIASYFGIAFILIGSLFNSMIYKALKLTNS